MSMQCITSLRSSINNKLVSLINNLSNDLIQEIACYEPNVLYCIKDPDNDLKLIIEQYELIKKNPDKIKDIKNPYDFLQLCSIKYNLDNINLINNPCNQVIKIKKQYDLLNNNTIIIKKREKVNNKKYTEMLLNEYDFIFNDSYDDDDKFHILVKLKESNIIHRLDYIEFKKININNIEIINTNRDLLSAMFSGETYKKLKLLNKKNNKNINKIINNSHNFVQIAFIMMNYENIKYIINKNDEIKNLAIMKDAFSIKYIKNPSKELQRLAIKQNIESLSLKNIFDYDVIVETIKQNGLAIKYIKDPDESLIIKAIKQTKLSIEIIGNSMDNYNTDNYDIDYRTIFNYYNDTLHSSFNNWSLIDIAKHNKNIQYAITEEFESKTEKEKEKIITHKPQIFKYIKNLTLQTQLSLVNKSPYNIKYIDDPCEQVQLSVVEKFGLHIEYIKNPTKKVKYAAIISNKHAVKYIKDLNDVKSRPKNVCDISIQNLNAYIEKCKKASKSKILISFHSG